MLNKTGSHNFSVTYDEHLENIRAFRAYQKERKRKKQEAKSTHSLSPAKSQT